MSEIEAISGPGACAGPVHSTAPGRPGLRPSLFRCPAVTSRGGALSSPLTSWRSRAVRAPLSSARPRSRCLPTSRRSAGSQAPSCPRGPGTTRRRRAKQRQRGSQTARGALGAAQLAPAAPQPVRRAQHRVRPAGAAERECIPPPSAASPPCSASCWRRRAARVAEAPGIPSSPASRGCARARCVAPRLLRHPRSLLRTVAAAGYSATALGTRDAAERRRRWRCQARGARAGSARCCPSHPHSLVRSLLRAPTHRRKMQAEELGAVGQRPRPKRGCGTVPLSDSPG